jgi:excisionase family DNA binding protein
MKKVENGNVGTPGTLLPLIELSKSRQQSFRHAFDSFNTLNNPIADSFASQSFGLSKRLGLQEFTQGTQILQPQRVRLESTVVPNLELEWDFIEGFRSLGMNLDEAPAELPAPKTETRSRSIQPIEVATAPIQTMAAPALPEPTQEPGASARRARSPIRQRPTNRTILKRINLNELLTVEELAAKLKVSTRTVHDWRYKRLLPFTRIGNRLYVPVGAVEEMLARNVIQPLPTRPSPTLSEQGGAQTGDHGK